MRLFLINIFIANTWSREIIFNLNPTKAKKGLLNTFWKKKYEKHEFEKWRTIRTSVGDVGGVLAWVACLHVWRACVGNVLVWVTWVVCLRGWHGLCASVGGMGGVLAWVACYYYFYCYYWNTILKKEMLNVYFWNKKEIMFPIILNSGLKNEPNVDKYTSIRLTCEYGWICLKQNLKQLYKLSSFYRYIGAFRILPNI